ncbi:MAG: hypothetical protein AAFP28_01980 [Pseudomonadota bacterium]
MRRLYQLFLGALLVAGLGATQPVDAQQGPSGTGQAPQLDIISLAASQDLQAPYPRALYSWIKANPQRLQDANFYVNFVSYLLSTADDFDCRRAFANEFERRDYFNGVFQYQATLAQIVNSARLTQNFDRLFGIDTGRYDFQTQTLPITRRRALDQGLDRNLNNWEAKNCAQQMLNGTAVDTGAFPWDFQIVDENIQVKQPAFPFENTLKLPENDARIIFETFGRDLFAIVSYNFVAANNGDYKIQIFPTDGTLFGLSADAVVRIRSYRHPQAGGAATLDFTNPMKISVPAIGLETELQFEQQDFRAVGKGTRAQAATGFSASASVPVTGTAAVGNSSFIVRLEVPGYSAEVPGLNRFDPTNPRQRYVTFFGKLDLTAPPSDTAPVYGTGTVLEDERDRNGDWRTSRVFRFEGAFTPKVSAEAAPAAPAAPQEAPALTPAPAPEPAPAETPQPLAEGEIES